MTLAPYTEALGDELRAFLPAAAFRPPEEGYLEEPRGNWHGQAGVVLAPGSTEEVAAVVRLAARERVGIVPRGGGTGLVGGQVMETGPLPIVLSLERMRRIREVLPLENVIVVDAGCILADVQAAAEAADRLFPLSLGSQGSARIGGLLSTNAGGVNVLRYGTARELVLGLEAVLPDGSVMHTLRRLRKDNTGYDIRNLLVGAEGTLGIITGAALRLFPRPARAGSALLVVPGPAEAIELLAMARDRIGDGLSAFELIAQQGYHFLTETGLGPRQPFAEPPEWSVLIDLGVPAMLDPDAMLEDLFVAASEAGLVLDGVISRSEAQRTDFWGLREAIAEANQKIGAIASQDVSLPLGAFPAFLEGIRADLDRLGPVRLNAFGHLGDGNLHVNVFPPKGEPREAWRQHSKAAARIIYEAVHRLNGSFSAEHGIGRLKPGELLRYGDPAKVAAMRAIKRALDPAGIMNPGAVLSDE